MAATGLVGDPTRHVIAGESDTTVQSLRASGWTDPVHYDPANDLGRPPDEGTLGLRRWSGALPQPGNRRAVPRLDPENRPGHGTPRPVRLTQDVISQDAYGRRPSPADELVARIGATRQNRGATPSKRTAVLDDGLRRHWRRDGRLGVPNGVSARAMSAWASGSAPVPAPADRPSASLPIKIVPPVN